MHEWPTTTQLCERLFRADGAGGAVAWDMPSFLAAYTLHDSYLDEVRLDPWAGLILLVQWDMVWNRQVPPEFGHLAIGISTVYSVQWSAGGWRQPAIGDATAVGVSAADRERMLDDGSVELRAFQGARDECPPPFDDPTLTRTTFRLMNWSSLHVLHGGRVHLLCVDDHGRAGPLPQRGR